MVETSESRWFKIVVFVVSGFFVGFSLANIIYFNRIRLHNGAPGVTRGEATSMLWINAMLFVVSIVIFIWSIYRLITTRQYRERVTEYFQEPHEGFIDASESGFPYPKAASRKTFKRAKVQGVTRTATVTDQ